MSVAGRIGRNSVVYSLAGLITRGMSLVLLPLYAHVLTPADYGILGVTSTVSGLLSIVLSLAVQSSFTRAYFNSDSEAEHRSLVGTLLAFVVVVPGLMALSLQIAGSVGWLRPFRSIPFSPFLSLTLWATYLSVVPNLLQTVYITKQHALRVMVLNVGNSVLLVGLSAYYLLYLKQGVVGSLKANLVSAMVMWVVSIALLVRLASWSFSFKLLGSALLYSAPLVPHLLSHWLLNMSDRIVLEPRVSGGDLGLYSLGYQLGLVLTIFTMGISNSTTPVLFGLLKDPDRREAVPRIGTQVVAAMWSLGLALALLGGHVIRMLTPVGYHRAATIVPWIVLGFALHGSYLVVSTGTFYSMRTGWIPVVTAVAGLVNVGLNLVLVPRFGIMAAAVNTAVGYGVLAVLHGLLAHKRYPIRWEYRQWVKIAGVSLLLFGAGMSLNSSVVWIDVLLKTTVSLGMVPLLLVTGAVTAEELGSIRRAFLRWTGSSWGRPA